MLFWDKLLIKLFPKAWYRPRLVPNRKRDGLTGIYEERVLWIFWRYHSHMDNYRRSLMLSIVEKYHEIQELLTKYDACEGDMKEGMSFVDDQAGWLSRVSVGPPFPDKRRPREAELPDVSDMFKKVEKFVRNAQGSHYKRPDGGTKSSYYLANPSLLPDRKDFAPDSDNHIQYKPQRSNTGGGSKNQQRRKGQGHQQDNRN